VDFTILWRRLSLAVRHGPAEPPGPARAIEPVRDLFLQRDAFDAWAQRLAQQRLQKEPALQMPAATQALMRAHQPAAWCCATTWASWPSSEAQSGPTIGYVGSLLQALERPFEAQPGMKTPPDFPPCWAQIGCSS
jgi:serine/tyrosine/threonine adenylyltransferase